MISSKNSRPRRGRSKICVKLTSASAFIESHPETQARFDRVARLIRGFETPFGIQLLATVHWVCTREGAKSEDETVERTCAWSERKKGFDRKQIALARDLLTAQGWLG
jgi:hypothetical protein